MVMNSWKVRQIYNLWYSLHISLFNFQLTASFIDAANDNDGESNCNDADCNSNDVVMLVRTELHFINVSAIVKNLFAF
jgi:hypothetical protein